VEVKKVVFEENWEEEEDWEEEDEDWEEEEW
jgi:hypothetical protein